MALAVVVDGGEGGCKGGGQGGSKVAGRGVLIFD